MAYINIALTNLGKYNEGELIYEWVNLPASEEEIQEALQKIGINDRYEEFFISDYETDIPGLTVDEYENIESLNEKAEELSNLSDTDLQIFENAVEAGFIGLDDIEDFDSSRYIMYWGVDTLDDLGYAIVDMLGGLGVLGTDTLKDYFDFESYGREFRTTWYAPDYDEEADPDISAYDYFNVSSDRELGEYIAYEFEPEIFSDTSIELRKPYVEFLERYFDYEEYARNIDAAGVGTFTSDGYIEDTRR